MNRICRPGVYLATFIIVGCANGAAFAPTQKFDEFGDLKCEDEMARLDNLAIQLQQEPNAKAVLIYYGGRTFRGKLPRRGESVARAARLKPYLVNRRGIQSNRIVVINGGYREEWIVEVWVVPPGASMPSPFPMVAAKQVRFRRGKASPRNYRCQI